MASTPYSPYKGKPPAKRLEMVLAVIVEHASYLPLTVRQVFYRAVGAFGRPKMLRLLLNLTPPRAHRSAAGSEGSNNQGRDSA